MRGNIQLLLHNFQEIYHAIQSSSSNSLPLVASSSGTYIYNAKYGWGRIWSWYYTIVNILTGHDRRLDSLKKAILKTHAIFLNQIEILRPSLESYGQYLKQLSGGYAVKENDFMSSREAITCWNRATKPFITSIGTIQHPIHPRLTSLFNYCFEDKKDPSEVFSISSISQAAVFQKIIDLEGYCGAPLPLMVFKKILKEKLINSIDHKEVSRWLKRVDQASVSVDILHRGLSAIASQYQFEPAILELFLLEKGCSILMQSDPKQLHWRQQLCTGAVLYEEQNSVDEIKVVLGNEINPSRAKIDCHRVFTISNDPQKVAVIPINRSLLAIEQLQKNDSWLKIETVRYEYISKNGKFALASRLRPLNSFKWSSAEGIMSSEDIPLVEKLTEIVRECIKQNQTPLNFIPKTLMFDDAYNLKTLKPLSKQPFDFNLLEEFVKDCAGGNNIVFQYIMKQSGLSMHSTAKFYKEVVRNAMAGDETSIEDLAAMYRIEDPKVVDRGIALVKEALKESF